MFCLCLFTETRTKNGENSESFFASLRSSFFCCIPTCESTTSVATENSGENPKHNYLDSRKSADSNPNPTNANVDNICATVDDGTFQRYRGYTIHASKDPTIRLKVKVATFPSVTETMHLQLNKWDTAVTDTQINKTNRATLFMRNVQCYATWLSLSNIPTLMISYGFICTES